RYDLNKYILADVPQPEDPTELKEWLDDRGDADDYLQAVVGGLKVWRYVQGMGWKDRDLNQKKTIDKLTQYL
ncbi:hypothetical protein N657DRAFT_545248, partial [Parathielavia appendiculata]